MSELSLSEASVLELVKEKKIHLLMAGSSADDTIEASGVCVVDDNYYVIFDDTSHIARFGPSLTADDPANALYRYPDDDIGREDITFDNQRGRFFVITEAVREKDGSFKPKVTVLDSQLRYVEEGRLDFPLEGKHKGMEGLTTVYRQGQLFLLGLCEGNFCHGGRRGRRPGGGRIQVFQRDRGNWTPVDTIELPEALEFENYSSLATAGSRIAVTSSAASALWLGELRDDKWAVVDQGKVYRFPLTKKNNVSYCAVDGISWLDDETFVAVSDRCRTPFRFYRRCRKKDQSIHIFRLPGS